MALTCNRTCEQLRTEPETTTFRPEETGIHIQDNGEHDRETRTFQGIFIADPGNAIKTTPFEALKQSLFFLQKKLSWRNFFLDFVNQ